MPSTYTVQNVLAEYTCLTANRFSRIFAPRKKLFFCFLILRYWSLAGRRISISGWRRVRGSEAGVIGQVRFVGSYEKLQTANSWGKNFGTMHRCAIIVFALLASGCDPIINIYGSFFPAWVVCLVTGVLFTVLLRLAFAVTQVERYLGPLILIYPSLTLLLTLVTWLIFFQT